MGNIGGHNNPCKGKSDERHKRWSGRPHYGKHAVGGDMDKIKNTTPLLVQVCVGRMKIEKPNTKQKHGPKQSDDQWFG